MAMSRQREIEIEERNTNRNMYISWAIYRRNNVGKIELIKYARATPRHDPPMLNLGFPSTSKISL
jgi:hypothetical protein